VPRSRSSHGGEARARTSRGASLAGVALRHAILAALLDGGASGYELSKRFAFSVANFWAATPQQLYRELDTLHARGLLSARVVEQSRRPNKRVFEITDEGLTELVRFTKEPASPTTLRDDLLVKLQAVDVADSGAVQDALRERVAQGRARLEQWTRLRESMLAGAQEETFLSSAKRVGPFLTLMRGIAFEHETIAWAERVLQILELRSTRLSASNGRTEPGPTNTGNSQESV